MTASASSWPPPFRDRLVALLDEYDGAPRGSTDHLLSAYVRACVSSRDALELRVARAARAANGSPDPGTAAWSTRPLQGSRPPLALAPMFSDDPRPEATRELALRLRAASRAANRSAS